jgi:serine protease Do
MLEPGDRVLAFGSPFGYVGSMTHGIVSALHRQAGILGSDGYENFIQVDAPINPGNSGGPLVDLKGDVVGINVAIASSSGGFQGIGFAIPAAQAKPIYETLKEKGKIVRGWLGVQIENVAQALNEAKSTGYQGTSGVLVKGVMNNSPGTGKLQPGDIVTSLDGKALRDASQLRNSIAMDAPGTQITLGVVRDGKPQDVKIKLGEQPQNLNVLANRGGENQEATASTLGMRLANLDEHSALQYGLKGKSGALVTEVKPNSPAAEAGLRPGDLITGINKQEVTDAQQAKQDLAKADLKKGIRLEIANREGSELLFVQSNNG